MNANRAWVRLPRRLLARALRELRVAVGLSLEETCQRYQRVVSGVDERGGVSVAWLCGVELGRCGILPGQLTRLAQALGVTLECVYESVRMLQARRKLIASLARYPGGSCRRCATAPATA